MLETICTKKKKSYIYRRLLSFSFGSLLWFFIVCHLINEQVYINLVKPNLSFFTFCYSLCMIIVLLLAWKVAAEVRSAIYDETGLTCSVGVAPNRMLAKVVSEVMFYMRCLAIVFLWQFFKCNMSIGWNTVFTV